MAITATTCGDVFRTYFLFQLFERETSLFSTTFPAHKDKTSLEMIEKAGAQVRFLPPYRPDLNEKTWSKVKQLLRGKKARRQEALLVAIGVALSCIIEADALDRETPTDC